MEFDTQDALVKHSKSEKHVVRPSIFTLFTSLLGQYFVRNTFLKWINFMLADFVNTLFSEKYFSKTLDINTALSLEY